MAIHWQIPFKSLRAGTDYTVNIYDSTYSGQPIVLKGGAQPFTTQEDDNDDMFTPIRTQTGYLRIVDDGKDANGNTLSASDDWKALLPSTDTDRPVTLTNGSGTVVWQGFMQAQNFGGVLYGNPQEREFPVHCPLTILEGSDINYQQKEIQNFAYLLQQITNCIATKGGLAVGIDNIIIQGNTDAQQWLLKRIDWQNFTSDDGDGNLTARFNLYQILEDVCRFWGWTARTYHRNIYLTCADDSSEQSFLSLATGSGGSLETMAGGIAAGLTGGAFTVLSPSGDIFASVEQNDYRQRGPNRSMVKVDTNRGEDTVLDVFNDTTIKAMKDMGQQGSMVHYVAYTNDLLSVDQPYLKVTCVADYASLNIGYFGYAYNAPYVNVIRIKRTGGSSLSPFVTIETKYEHCFNDGFLRIYGQTYRYTEEFIDNYEEYAIGRSYMYARIFIGKVVNGVRQGMWWNGQSWQSSATYCRLSIGNKENNLDGNKNEFFFETTQQPSTQDDASNLLSVSGLQGRLIIDLMGTDSTRVSEIDGQRSFELKDFKVEFTRNPGVVKHGSANYSTYAEDIDRPTSFEYKANNQNNVRMDWDADCVYATENKFKFSYGELINPNGTFCESVSYNGTNERPEQHLANRVVNYWASAKRKLEVELRTDAITEPSPQNRMSIDSTTGYPITVGREWRNDVTKLTILEL